MKTVRPKFRGRGGGNSLGRISAISVTRSGDIPTYLREEFVPNVSVKTDNFSNLRPNLGNLIKINRCGAKREYIRTFLQILGDFCTKYLFSLTVYDPPSQE